METKRYLNLRIPLPSGMAWARRLLPTPGNVLFTLLVGAGSSVVGGAINC